MQKHYNYLTIDLDKKNYRIINAKQGDSKSRYILVNLISNSTYYDLTGTSVKIFGKKKDTTIFFNNATITDAKQGRFEIELTNQALAIPGYLKIEILVSGANQERLSTSHFYINVEETIIDDAAIESTNEFTALTTALSEVQNIDNRFAKVDEQFNTFEIGKASKVEVDVERKRIDSLTKLTEGSTTGDAELIDGRVGMDGVTYDNIGTSIRTQISNINQSINYVYTDFTESFSILNLNFVNKSVNNEGVIGNSNNIRATHEEFIYIPSDNFLKIKLNDNNYVYNLYKFNLGKNFEKATFNINKDIYVDSGYYRVLIYKKDSTSITINQAKQSLTFYKSFINKNKEININWTEGRYVNYTDGKDYPFDNYFYTNYFINVSNLRKLILTNIGASNYSINLSGIAFYDKYYNYTSGNQREQSEYMIIDIPKNAYYCKLTSISNSTKVFKVEKEINNDFNPTTYEGKEITVFNNILCIGDSLTAGVFNYSENGGGLGQRSQYSYPSQLAKITGCNVTNWGISGATTQSWYEDKITIDKWQWYDCAIINLGANDIPKNSVTTSSSKQYLQKIIDKLKDDNKNIKIFLVTVIPAYYNKDVEWYSSINQTRYELTRTNENCYFVDMSKYSETGNDIYHFGHLTALGYRKEAEELVAYISKIIVENMKEFKWVQHIGTTHLGE